MTKTQDPVGNKGLLASIQSRVSTTSFLGYDAMGRITSSQETMDGASYLFQYTYNKAGLLETQTYPGGRQTRTCSDNSGEEISQTGVLPTPNKAYAAGAVYASHGALSSVTIGPGAVSMAYNPSHRQLTQSKVNGYWQMDLSYCPNGASPCATNNGNLHRIVLNDTTATRTQNFSYDSANRLKTAVETGLTSETNGFSQTYEYDQYGNRWITPTSTLPGGIFHPTSAAWFDAATNRLQSVVGNTYLHDAAGNMIGEGSATFAYDGEGRMKRSTVPYATGTVITQYFYDGEGRRVKKQNQALGKTLYIYDAFGKLAVEFPEQAFAPCTTCYLYTDHLNTTRLVLDQSGTVMKRADHMPFGEEILNGASWANGRGTLYADNHPVRQQFTGYLRNEAFEWAMDFANARYYRRSNGRFTSPDLPLLDQNPDDAHSWNLYSYVRNNPLKYHDPDGRICVWGIGNTCNEELPAPPKPPAAPSHPVFPTIDSAGVAAARLNQSRQKSTGAEHASSVYEVGGVAYTYTDPVTQGQHTTVDPHNTTGKSKSIMVPLTDPPIPRGAKLVAETHSHPEVVKGYNGQPLPPAKQLSPQDMLRNQDLSTVHRGYYAGYVGLPDGRVIKYEPRAPSGQRVKEIR